MASAKIKHLDKSSFDSTIANPQTPVLVDFWAEWCGPCKAIAPVLDEIAEELDGQVQICKLDVDTNQEIATRFNVRAIPTLIIFKNGESVEEIVGMANKADLIAKIKSHLN